MFDYHRFFLDFPNCPRPDDGNQHLDIKDIRIWLQVSCIPDIYEVSAVTFAPHVCGKHELWLLKVPEVQDCACWKAHVPGTIHRILVVFIQERQDCNIEVY